MPPDATTRESVTRTREIEEFTNLYIIHPAAARLTPLLARLDVRPNAVSLTGMGSGILAGWAYAHYPDLRWLCTGFLLMVAWHVLDGVDGQLARLTNRQSDFGKVIDGIADYTTFSAVYLGLGMAMSRDVGSWVWSIVAAAGAAHVLQAAVYEAHRQEYDFWGWGKQSAEYKSAETLRGERAAGTGAPGIIGALGGIYARLQQLAGGVDPRFREHLALALAAGAGAEPIQQQYRATFAPLVRYESLLSSNYRTIAIFVLAALKVPLWYFLVELLLLSALTMLAARAQRAKRREFALWLNRRCG